MHVKSILASIAVGLALWSPAMADVTIGVAIPRTGNIAAIGQQVINGVNAAVEDLNAKGGIAGQKIVVDVQDDVCEPRQAVSVANRFIASGVKLIVGHVCSGASLVASDIYAEAGALMVTPASNSAKLTDRGLAGIFRVCGRDDQQGQVAAEIIAKRWGNKRIAILHDNTPFSKGLADSTKANLNKAGIQEAYYGSITPGERDYIALISRLKAGAYDLVYYGGYQQEFGTIVRQAKDQDYAPQFFGTSAIATNEFGTIAGAASDGVLFTFNPDPRKQPRAAAVVQALRAKGVEPEGFTLYGYAALQAIVEAANKAGSTEPKRVEAALKSNPFNLILGDVSFSQNGDISAPGYVLYLWKGGKYDYAP